MTVKPWASFPLAGGVNQALSALEVGMHIALIATFDLKTCHINETVEFVLANPELEEFDYIPVSDCDNIVGVFHRQISSFDKVEISVGEVMQKIDESIIISANASLLSFIEDADNQPFRLILHGKRIVGIVTLSDLQKFAVRPVLFALITCVELLLAEWLRRKYPDQNEWLATLSESRSTIIEQRWIAWKNDNMAMDKASVTEFCDKRDAALNLGAFPNKSAARKKLKEVESLRHAVTHSGDYALTPENARNVARTVRYARETIAILQDSLQVTI
ncbi:hypothetical protein ACE1CD_35400 [Aerosakkonema sp. BLCC-F183]|uniref:hypothetical protein n=1 Tax=Aerosakkonema sp. BLCC-F183 TaxID=3342834 RepID=UPI0035B8AEB4